MAWDWPDDLDEPEPAWVAEVPSCWLWMLYVTGLIVSAFAMWLLIPS